MKEWVKVCLIAFLVVAVTPSLVTASTEIDDPKRVILTYEKDEGMDFLDEIPHSIHHHYERLGAVALTVNQDDLPLFENEEAVTSIEEDQQVKVSAQQEGWGYTSVGTQKSEHLGLTGEGVKVAVIDTGINTNHPDLKVTGGASFVEDETFVDDNGHGTHVAGIIGALDNDEGTIGIAPKAQLYAVKVLDQDGNGLVSSVLAGIEWAIEKEMDIINLSLTACTPSDLTKQALQDAKDAGIIVVAASGNRDVCTYNDVTDVLYPARYPGIVSVGAVEEDQSDSGYTYGGPSLDFTAPGMNIKSTYIATEDQQSGYETLSGSSMAAPHVTGVLTLYKEMFPEFDKDELLNIAINNSLDLGESGKDNIYGHGMIQAPTTPFSDFERDRWYSGALELMARNNWISGYRDASFMPQKEITREEVVSIIGRILDLDNEQRETRFSDVPKETFGSGYIDSAVEAGFVNGYPDGTFRPKDLVTRGDVAILIHYAFNIEGDKELESFPDISTEDYYYDSVTTLKDSGIVNGYPDGTYRPTEDISRSEVVYMLYKVIELK
ncbi:S8 family peptidase [Halobacillus trueperi]|uniref:SLH domain-containing protein n=1 Tax=Halobacillus trueperi TaxID=156205 RepID=A0A3E0J7D6_9BACI|nr:S8 family serine peptidase [Halobacillus trueperi]REJ08791.1 hypothetical protein DYE48_12240 [Halobacillus trueperi]